MKTAMQELLSEMSNPNWDRLSFDARYEMFDKLLDLEKEQIKDAWDAGMSEGIGTTMADLDWDGEFINYYNETYTK